MDSAANRLQLSSRLQRFLFLTWHFLCSPKTTGVLVAVLVVVVGLRLLVPQQPISLSETARTTWITSLPPLVQFWGDELYVLGFARIFQSLWFWLPLGLLFLNSLVALADYVPGSWRRLQNQVPPLTWQHPLARRIEHSARLPESPDKFLVALKEKLRRQNFYVYEPGAVEERLVGAARRRWAWLGVVALYSGVALVAIACLVSYHFSKSESLVLRPSETVESRLFGGNLELSVSPGGDNPITYIPAGADETGRPSSPLILTWRLYRPAFFYNTLAWPFAADSVLTVEVRDETNRLLKLIPVQENLAPADRLNLLIPPAGTPLYFSIPSTGTAVQILPEPDHLDRVYEVQIRHGSNPTAATSVTAQAGEKFTIDGLTITLTPNAALRVLAYRDPALILYLISALLIFTGGVVLLWQPPLQLWLIADVKGRGGQLYGVLEKLGPMSKTKPFLEPLLEKLPLEPPEQNGQMVKNIVGE